MSSIEVDDSTTNALGAELADAKAAKGLRVREVLQQISLLMVWIIVVIIFGSLRPDTFLTVGNFSGIFGTNATLAVLALALIVVLRAGDYDLSVAAIMTTCSVTLGVLNVEHHISLLWSIVIAVLFGTALGALNAFIVVIVGVDSFIATLGMGTVLGGVALWFSGQQQIVGVSDHLTNWVIVKQIFGIPIAFYYAIAIGLIIFYVFRYTAVGRRLLFVGKNREVSRLSGVHVKRVRFGAFVVAGFIAAIAALLYTGSSGTADPTSGISYLLPAYAAAFLGATCIEIGGFNPIGTLIAVYFLVTGVSGLAILGVQNYVQNIFYGAVLIVAVAGSQAFSRSRSKVQLD
jgi:ribose transport system permease protein